MTRWFCVLPAYLERATFRGVQPKHAATDGGTIRFRGFSFAARGRADVPFFGHCDDGELFGSVTRDGQHIEGAVTCFGATLSITADRS